MQIYGATIYVLFDTLNQDERLKEMMNYKHKNFRHIPNELVMLRDKLQNQYDFFIPIDFRSTYALKKFEMMGILNHYEDAIDIVLELEERMKALNYKTMITAGFGTAAIPDEYKMMNIRELLNQILGYSVYSAFEYFKETKVRKRVLPYHFFSFHHKFRRFNVKPETLNKRKELLKSELRELQKIDEQLQRHTYYPDFHFE